MDFAGHPEAAGKARQYVRDKLGPDHPALDDLTLLVSEVVTNALVHSVSRQGGRVTLALADCWESVHVDVVDDGGETVPHVQGDVFSESGRGLLLVETIADRWGVYQDEAGRTVWFEVAYRRTRKGSRAPCPPQRTSDEPPRPQDSAMRAAAERAARTVSDGLRRDQGREPAGRWRLVPDGLKQAAERLGVDPWQD
ncbi:hypothetical protein Sru01_11310 [Sphaerisporangium rufum]|uniref:Histidine kinase/HSP90-like ATPase domain-containing protein n=1 Tax=Sphaerisporangium rufum TaxID=1381558 RepID=A0A919QXV9_9ACTN|nr:ATP-binding protein [Sphaerisporangium rufum]GII76149.1 hypothetical protein Sru01_11310 [Sphaerisporangium rufum]